MSPATTERPGHQPREGFAQAGHSPSRGSWIGRFQILLLTCRGSQAERD